jgi:hypothetical protein
MHIVPLKRISLKSVQYLISNQKSIDNNNLNKNENTIVEKQNYQQQFSDMSIIAINHCIYKQLCLCVCGWRQFRNCVVWIKKNSVNNIKE